jgi:hypothetical protein
MIHVIFHYTKDGIRNSTENIFDNLRKAIDCAKELSIDNLVADKRIELIIDPDYSEPVLEKIDDGEKVYHVISKGIESVKFYWCGDQSFTRKTSNWTRKQKDASEFNYKFGAESVLKQVIYHCL